MECLQPTKKITVLVAEDQALIRQCTVGFLEDEGYRVLEATNGQEALKALQNNREIALLLTDVSMPGDLNGVALVETAYRDFPHIRSVVVSGKLALKDSALPGDARFVPKPYTPKQISEAVRQSLS
jgi:CheY-like chemotaxis protein